MATDIDTSGTPTATDRKRLKADARAGDDLLADVYEEGRKEGRTEARARSKPSPRARANKATGSARSAGRRARRSARAGAAGTSLTGLVVLSLGLVALYTFLRSASHVGGFLGGLRQGVEWLTDPHAVIPYGGS